MWKNLLPQGTSAVELTSGYALILAGIFTYFGLADPITTLDTKEVLGVLIATFGCLQAYSILQHPKLELLRTTLSWLAGCFWIWLAIVTTEYHWTLEDICTLFLGLGNLYGFIINFNLLHIAWTE